MTRTILLATTATAALLASHAAPAQPNAVFAAFSIVHPNAPFADPRARTLYTQNSNGGGEAVLSQNCTSSAFTSCSGMAADDFVIPSGKTWRIGQVDVTGLYFDGSGPAKSVNVIFWKDRDGMPGKALAHGTYSGISCTDQSGSFACRLPTRLRLRPGHYWVTVQANLSLVGEGGEWGWESTSVIYNDPAVQSCGAGCWSPLEEDLMFDLKT